MGLEDSAKASSKIDVSKGMDCIKRGHPYPERVLGPYNPRTGTTLVECSNCGIPYERIGNEEERNSYVRMRRLEITI